jgi:type II secretory ATPase GspE/PulE/Tfp pilus assembly ATPase PilB-like protein
MKYGILLSEYQAQSRSKGCGKCFDTGYTGKLAIVETLEFSRTLKDSFVKGADYDEIEKLAKEEGVLHTLADDARRKFLKGDIDLEAARSFTL